MNKTLLALAVLAALAVPAAAGGSLGLDQSFGTDDYQSTKIKASADVNDTWAVMPWYTRYKTNFTNGTYNDYGLRVTEATGPLSVGFQGSILPEVNRYQQGAFGADLTYSFHPGGSRHGHKMTGPDSGGDRATGVGLTAADFGVAGNGIIHSDDSASKSYHVLEGDFSAFGGLRFLYTDLSAYVTKSAYTKNIDTSAPRPAPYLNIYGVGAIEQGYPDVGYDLRLKWLLLPLIHPYISYAHTTFHLGESPSNALEFGGTVSLGMLNIKAAYEHYSQSGVKDRNYMVLGASLNFGG